MLDPRHSGRPLDSSVVYGHSRTRTTSSNTFPVQAPTPLHLASPAPINAQNSRRSPSVNTFSTTSTMAPPAAYGTSPTTDLRRSTSSRSGGHAGSTSPQPTSYVALLRKQKATVWCDRAQYEDPRILAQQRAAKMKATLEVIGGAQRSSTGFSASPAGRTSTGISATGKVAAKIRHHGKATAVVGYAPGENHVGVGGVPMRLSATEVEGESSDDLDDGTGLGPGGMSRLHHRRTGSSGRSSTASRRGIAYRTSGGLGGGPGSIRGSQRWSPGDTPERTGSLVEGGAGGEPLGRASTFEQQHGLGIGITDDAASGKARSTGSGSSAERADNVGELGNAPRLASNSLVNQTVTREKSTRSVEDLRRRGSVDERTMTLTTGRLYIANPD